MFRVRALLALLVFVVLSPLAARAEDPPPLFPEPEACAAQPDDPSIRPEEKSKWSDCEKWVWSCLRQGLEANLFSKAACMVPRSAESNNLRKRLRLAAFYKPERFEKSNLISGSFVVTAITDPHYARQLGNVGVRIYGAYYTDPINLENYTTDVNIVLDGSVMRRGVRLTNFKTDKNLSLDGSNVRGSIFLMRSRIQGSLFLEAGVYDYVDLNDAKVGASFEASSSLFNDEIRIHRATIDGKVILTKARLTTLTGWNAELGSSVEMRLADVRYGIDLSGSHVKGDVRMQDVTFARQTGPASAHCDWDPDLPSQNVLHELKTAVPAGDFATVYEEVVLSRPTRADGIQPNVCAQAQPADAKKPSVLSDRNSVLLRDMRIDGALCLVDVTGEIPFRDDPARKSSIGKIAIDGTQTNATILSWHDPSTSPTLWYMANYKTNYLLANLENAPLRHYTDNIDVGALTMMKRSAIYASSEARAVEISDEYRVREKCDVTPGIGNNELAADRTIQDRIIRYFNADKSESSQPFANIVSRIDTMGVNTTHLKIALSEHKNRNACASSQLMRNWNDLPWAGVSEKLASASLDEGRKFVLDGVCSLGLVGLKYSVSYGHEPHNLIFIALFLVLIFAFALRFDKPVSQVLQAGPRLGLTYALDNLIPLKPYRFNRLLADEKPNRPFLRAWLVVHRILGATLAILAFFFIYKASQ